MVHRLPVKIGQLKMVLGKNAHNMEQRVKKYGENFVEEISGQ